MKKQFIHTVHKGSIALVTLLFASSCSFLDIEPTAIRTGDNFMNDETNAELAINAAYNSLASHERWSDGLLESHSFYIGEIMADYAEMGSHKGDFDDLERMIEWRPYTDEIILYCTWKRCYDGIYRCDYVLENISEAPISEALKQRIEGEAYFLRGMNILRLATMFGSIPITEGIIQPESYGKIPQKNLHECFEIAAHHFGEAINKLPTKNQYESKNLDRATKGAAQAMLARLYMLQEGMDKDCQIAAWDSVYKYTDLVIKSSEYALVNNYATIHEPEGENNIESIFEIQFGSSSILNSGSGNSREDIGTTSQIRCGIRSAQNEGLPGGWGYYQPSQLLVDEYEAKDPRLTCVVYGPNYNEGIVYGVKRNYDLSDMQSEYYNRRLAIDPALEAEALMTATSNSSRNVRVIRYADVLLMNAEAAYHLGREAEVQDKLEMVRQRARNSTYAKGFVAGKGNVYVNTGYSNNLPKVTATGQELLEAIWHERSVELALEDMRYWDLVRTGRYLDRLDVIKATSKDPTAIELRFANIDLRANCAARCIAGPRGVKDIPIFPLPGEEAIKWNLSQIIDLYK